MKTRYIFFMLIFFANMRLFAQAPSLSGTIFSLDAQGKKEALPGATIINLSEKEGTTSDAEGHFSLHFHSPTDLFSVSYVGFKTDTFSAGNFVEPFEIILASDEELDEITITERQKGLYLSSNFESMTTVVSSEGLKKLPCCNLSESFENNAAVDVVFTDAVSGAKQIQMLGLSGIYSQIMSENRPAVRGLAVPFGLTFVPGSWLESIQISKGAASVVNGYESISGQINYELKKPDKSERFFANLYGNSEGRAELTANAAHRFTEHFSTMLSVQGADSRFESDMNHDGFKDFPTGNQVNFFNRWLYDNHHSLEVQAMASYMKDERKGGQTSNAHVLQTEHGLYTTGITTERAEAVAKLGFVIPETDASVGSMFSFTNHIQNSRFGHRVFNARQSSIYGNVIFDAHIAGENHKINTGISFVSDVYTQNLLDTTMNVSETVPGAFVQYNYKIEDKLSVIIGLRGDYSSENGFFMSPRLHLKYNPAHHTTIRVSGGKGYRSALPLAENISVLASARTIYFFNNSNFESAWNYGASISQDFDFITDKPLKLTIDYFRTDFENQVLLNLDASGHVARFENLTGDSYSNSYQIELNATPIKMFDITAAARYNDVKVTVNDKLVQKPLMPRWKGLLTLSYRTRFSKWQFDITNQFTGKSRIPYTADNSEGNRLNEYSDSFYILHLQITRRFKKIEIYLGAENATDYRQDNPILGADDPFSSDFDAGLIWGPTAGRMIFAGLRFTLK